MFYILIEALRNQGISITKIAAAPGVNKSTISRELKRNSIKSCRPKQICKQDILKPILPNAKMDTRRYLLNEKRYSISLLKWPINLHSP